MIQATPAPAPTRVTLLVGAVLLASSPLFGGIPLVVDLAKAPSEVTLPIAPGTYDVTVQNLLPKGAYHIQAALSTILRDPLDLAVFKPGKVAEALGARDPCADLATALERVATATEEEQVKEWRPVLTDDLRTQCPAQARAADALDYQAGTFRLEDETQLDVTITRGTKTWHLTWKSEKPGVWLTSYGFMFIPTRDKNYFSKADSTGGTYTITRETNRHSTDFAPAVFFTWYPADWRPLGGHAGFTGGLGFDLENPVVFTGLSWLFHQNLGIAAGLVMHKERDLKGKFSPDQQIHENLSSDDLTDLSYRPNVFFGLTFRFGQSPFKSTPTQTAAPSRPATPEAPPPSPTPAAPPQPSTAPGSPQPVPTPMASARVPDAPGARPRVWVNPGIRVYYCANSNWYRHTSVGGMEISETDAVSQGFRPAFGLPCGASALHPPPVEAFGVRKKRGCGVERWPVKTLTDSSPADTDQPPTDVTVAELLTIPRPTEQLPSNERLAPTETTVFRVHARLELTKREDDGDLHLVIHDLDDPEVTMIAEVPSQQCAQGSKMASSFASLQKRLGQYVGKKTNLLVELQGVGFFDFLHNQTGVAPNGLELHPVVALQIIKE